MKIDLTRLGEKIMELIDEAEASAENAEPKEEYSAYLGEIEIDGIEYQLQLRLQSDEYELLEPLLDSVIS